MRFAPFRFQLRLLIRGRVNLRPPWNLRLPITADWWCPFCPLSPLRLSAWREGPAPSRLGSPLTGLEILARFHTSPFAGAAHRTMLMNNNNILLLRLLLADIESLLEFANSWSLPLLMLLLAQRALAMIPISPGMSAGHAGIEAGTGSDHALLFKLDILIHE